MTSMPALPTCAALLLTAGLIMACDGGGSCADLAAASAPCPIPVYGYARVNGTVLDADGAPAPSKEAFVDCPDGVGRSGSLTDGEGRFAVFMEYYSSDTIIDPLPPRAPDGSFNLSCEANAGVMPEVVARESLLIKFTPTIEAIVPSTVELRAPAP